MTGSASDPPDWQPHIRNKPRREALANRFRDATDPLRIVLVRDMWLTGFDAPSLHTMYVDKPMRGHGLMQAIARVNRVFRDAEGLLVRHREREGLGQGARLARTDCTAWKNATSSRRGAPRGGPRPRRAPDHLSRGGARRRAGHLRRGGTQQARHLDPVRRVPR
jgi:hypothetical protein